MKTLSRWFLLLSLLISPLSAQNSPATADREARAKTALEERLAYAASPEYNPYDSKIGDIRKAAVELQNKKQFPQAIAEAQKGLARSKYNIDLLIILASCYRATGDGAKADQIRAQWISLMDSILSSGDGRDYATAFKVITVDEEYSVLRILQLEKVSQSLVAHDGSEFDLMSVRNPESGKDFVIYFNVDLPKKWLDRHLAK